MPLTPKEFWGELFVYWHGTAARAVRFLSMDIQVLPFLKKII
jgi:hypothetical protein